MTESLREISELLARFGVDLLRQQPHVVGEAYRALEQLVCLVELAAQRKRIDQPEGAQGEGSLATGESVLAFGSDRPVRLLSGADGSDRPSI